MPGSLHGEDRMPSSYRVLRVCFETDSRGRTQTGNPFRHRTSPAAVALPDGVNARASRHRAAFLGQEKELAFVFLVFVHHRADALRRLRRLDFDCIALAYAS